MATEIDTAIVLPDDPSLGPEVQVDYPGYRSTRWRAPDRPLVTLPEEFHSLTPRWHFTHIHDDVIPALLARGVTDAQIETMLVGNPRRYFAGT